jgi:hypothetical protein
MIIALRHVDKMKVKVQFKNKTSGFPDTVIGNRYKINLPC